MWMSRRSQPRSAQSRWWREAARWGRHVRTVVASRTESTNCYQCRLKDLPLAELGFVIRLTVRRFICGVADCPRRTFAEPFSRLAAPHARFTTRLNHALERVGLALARRAGARLAAQLGSARDG